MSKDQSKEGSKIRDKDEKEDLAKSKDKKDLEKSQDQSKIKKDPKDSKKKQPEQDDEEQKLEKDQDDEMIDPNLDISKLEPYNNDNEQRIPTEQQVARLTDDPQVFMTQHKQEDFIWKSFDFLFPAGKLAKLVKVTDFWQKTFPYMDILTKVKLDEGYPVVNFIGARHDFNKKPEEQRGKFYAGIARACFNTDAVIVDNAVTTGIEKFALKRGLKVVGVAPENMIQFPKLNPTSYSQNELSNGHTHLLLLNNLPKDLKWGGEAQFKINLCKKIAEGKLSKTNGRPRCKIVNILFCDDTSCFDEIREAIVNDLPIIVVKGSPLCDRFIEREKEKDESKKEAKKGGKGDSEQVKDQQPAKKVEGKEKYNYSDPTNEFDEIMSDRDGIFFPLDSLKSEEIAQFVHFLLTYTPWIKVNQHGETITTKGTKREDKEKQPQDRQPKKEKPRDKDEKDEKKQK